MKRFLFISLTLVLIFLPKKVFAWENIGYNVNRMYWGNANVAVGTGLNTTPTYTQETNFDNSLVLNAPVQDNTGIHMAFARSLYYIIGTNTNLVQGHTYLITIGIRRNNPYVVRYVQDRPQYTHNDDLQFLYVGTGTTNVVQNEYSVSWKYDQSIGEYGLVDTATIRVKVNTNGTGFIFQYGNANDNNFMYVNANQNVSYLSIWTASVVDMGASATDSAIADMTNQLNDINNNILQSNQKLDNIDSGINNVNNSINDSNIDINSNDFLDFDFYDNNTLVGVVTAPLRFINSLTTTCQPVNLPIFNSSITIPCGTTIFWERQDVSNFRLFWNTLFGGLIIYRLVLKLFHVVNDCLDPTKDNVEGVEI